MIRIKFVVYCFVTFYNIKHNIKYFFAKKLFMYVCHTNTWYLKNLYLRFVPNFFFNYNLYNAFIVLVGFISICIPRRVFTYAVIIRIYLKLLIIRDWFYDRKKYPNLKGSTHIRR